MSETSAVRPGHNFRVRSSLVGRDEEVAAFDLMLEEAAGGNGRLALVGGEPGVGKTRLLFEIGDRARASGWLVLCGRAWDTEGMPPYLPFVEVMREHLSHSSDEALAALAAGAPELRLLLPEMNARVPGLTPSQSRGPGADDLRLSMGLQARSAILPQSQGPEIDRFRLFEAVSGFLINAARETESTGLVVLLDDLQWADRATVMLLGHLARKLPGSTIVVAGAYRTTDVERGHPLLDVLANLTREHLCDQILLAPLAESDTATLIENIAGVPASPAFAMRVHHDTAGNPFFVEEVVRHLWECGSDLSVDAGGWCIPESVRQVLSQRFSRLDPATNEALQTASVLGETFGFDLLAAASELDSRLLTSAMDAAEGTGMLRQEGDGYAFAHALVRRAIYDEMSVPRRRHLHLRAAEATQSLNTGDGDSLLVVIAHHWRLSGHPERATGHLLRAGDAAVRLTAWEEAARHWEAALECMEQTGQPPERRARLLEGLGDLYFLSSFQAHPSVERYLRASTLYESAGDLVASARARSRAGRSLAFPSFGFDYPAALDHLRAAEKVLSAELPSLELGELYAAIAHAESHALRNRPDEMVRAMRSLQEIAEQLDNEFLRDFLRVHACHLQGHYLGLQGHLAEGLALEERATETASGLKDRGGTANQWPERWHEFLLAYSSDDGNQAAADTGSLQFSRVSSRPGLANGTANCCGWQYLDLHDPVAARAKHERIRDAQGRFISPFLLFDLFLSGDIATLRRLIEGGASTLSPINPETMISARLLLDWVEGRWAEAESHYAERLQQWAQDGSNSLIAWTDHPLLRLARIRGDGKTAEAAARQLLDISLSGGAVKYEFYARAELALLLAESGRLFESEAHLARCREVLTAGEDWRGLAGRAMLAEGVHAAARGLSTEAEAQFMRAIECFRRLSLPWDEAEAFEIWANAGRRLYRGRTRRAFVAERLDCARGVYERLGAGQPWFDRLDAQERRLLGIASPGTTVDLPDGLTMREIEILRLVAAGASGREIGEQLVLSVRTVERHIANVYLKTGTHGRAQATSYALGHGLGPPPP